MRYIFFLGSHPAISAAECWNVLAAQDYNPKRIAHASHWLTVECSKELSENFLERVGGTDRIAVMTAEETITPNGKRLLDLLALPKRKASIGISVIGISSEEGRSLAIDLKRQARAQGHTLRFILPMKGAHRLNAAQVLFNTLYKPPNHEVTIVRHHAKYFVADTIQVQDIQAYEERDRGRPAASGRVGMLPLKLAQMMINLTLPAGPSPNTTTYDPFCGFGTILQEGWLMGHTMIGSDISPNMVASSQTNLRWLASRSSVAEQQPPHVFSHDVRKPFPDNLHGSVDAVVTEPYLGEPLRAPLSPTAANKAANDLRELYMAFFQNIKPILKKDARILFLFPAWRTDKASTNLTFFPTSTLDDIKSLGYAQLQLVPEEIQAAFPPTDRQTLLYARSDAHIARELTLWNRPQ